MTRPEIPKNEELRLEELYSYQILDTEPEEHFDDLVWMAAELAKTPMAMISLVEKNRQWFKSKTGFVAEETSREVSFCGHVVASGQSIVVEDTTKDSRFADNPLVTKHPNIRFYMGVPLISPSGSVLGTLCVMDTVPRTVCPRQIRSLKTLAHQVVTLMNRKVEGRALIRNNQLTSIGELAGGIAHEINNPMAIISGRTQILRRMIEENRYEPEKFEKDLQVIQATCDRIVKVIRGLLKMSRGTVGDTYDRIRFGVLVEEVTSLFNQKLSQGGVSLVVEGDPSVEVECRSIEISQVLMNLISNAIDSLVSANERKIFIRWAVVGQKLRVEIEDTGAGIPADLRDRVMKAYFTTKPAGQGTGLGLSISQKICEAHHGRLELDSQTEVAKFVMTLPLELGRKSRKAA